MYLNGKYTIGTAQAAGAGDFYDRPDARNETSVKVSGVKLSRFDEISFQGFGGSHFLGHARSCCGEKKEENENFTNSLVVIKRHACWVMAGAILCALIGFISFLSRKLLLE